MQTILPKMVIAVAVTVIGSFGADNSLGRWKRNIAKSKTSTPIANPIKTLTLVNEALNDGVKQSVTGERTNGDVIKSSHTVKYDGKEYFVSGAPWDKISIKQIDANNFVTEARQSGGKYHTKGQIVISKDGRTMTVTTSGTNSEGKPLTATFVYEKQ